MWFTENPWPPMLVAGLAAAVCYGVYNTERRRLYLYLAMALLGMTGGIYAVERAIVTEGEQIQNDVALMCDQFRRRDPQTLEHFSEFAPEWKSVCQSAMEMVQIQNDLRLTDFETTFTNNRSRVRVHFRANGTISTMGATAHHPFRCIFTYQKEGGLWKIFDVERLDPFNGTRMEVMEHR